MLFFIKLIVPVYNINSIKMNGVIKFFNSNRGFGMISSGTSEYFFHISNVISPTLHDGQNVKFDTYYNDKKQRTEAVKVIGLDTHDKVVSIKPKRRPRQRNTESFKPNHNRTDMRIVSVSGGNMYPHKYYPNEVIIVHDLFNKKDNLYTKLYDEVNNNETFLFKLWHGDTHYIVDDKLNWKDNSPTFNSVLEHIKNYFNVDIKATRFNYYKDTSQWKPYHHDAAAIKPDKAKEQNITIAVSFGGTRDVAFEHAKTRTKLSMPIGDCQAYIFNKDVNVEWRHGILQDKNVKDEGRISIIVWGRVIMEDY